MNIQNQQPKLNISQSSMVPQQQRPQIPPRPPVQQPGMAQGIATMMKWTVIGMITFVGLVLGIVATVANFHDFAKGTDGLMTFIFHLLPTIIVLGVSAVLLKVFKKEFLHLAEFVYSKVIYTKSARSMATARVKQVEATTKHIEARAENSKLEALSRYELILSQAKEREAQAWQKFHSLPVGEQNSAIGVDPLTGQYIPIAMPQAQFPAHLHSLSYHDSSRVQGQTRVTEEPANQIEGKPPVPTGRELLTNGTVEKYLAEGRIILGMLDNGDLATLKIKRTFTTLVSGLPGVGKTTTVFWIAGQLVIIGARLWIVDPHINFQDEEGNRSLAAELDALADSFVFPPCDDDPRQVIYRVQFMYKELLKRQQPGYIVRAKDTVIGIMDEYNSVADSIDPSMTVVKHEGHNLNFAQSLALIEREGRKFGLHFMLIGHKWAKQDIGGDNAVRTNATTYLCHKLNDPGQAGLLLGNMGKEILKLTTGQYWITGPTWNSEPAKISTPMISAADLPLLLAIKKRGVEIQKPTNVIESDESPAISAVVSEDTSEDISEAYPDAGKVFATGYNTESLGKLPEMSGDDTSLSGDLQAKMYLVLDMDTQQPSQNEIIKTVWGVEPSTRAGQKAAEELRQIRAHLAGLNRKRLQQRGA